MNESACVCVCVHVNVEFPCLYVFGYLPGSVYNVLRCVGVSVCSRVPRCVGGRRPDVYQ